MREKELKPCPFCGGEAKLKNSPYIEGYDYWVECEDCFVSTATYGVGAHAMVMWNTRCKPKKNTGVSKK